MGYQAPLELLDARTDLWVGEHRPDLVDLGGMFRRVVGLDVAAIEPGLSAAHEAWRAVLPEDVQIVRLLSPRAVHVHAPRGNLVKDLVIKVMLPRPNRGWRRIALRLDRSRSFRSHLWAHRLRAIGIDTPRPLGYVERATTPGRYVSFAATEYIFAHTLVDIRDKGMSMLGVGGRAFHAKRALIERVAAVFRSMHAHRMFHADLHAGNLLIDDESVLVIDLESMRRFPLPGRATLRSLVRLNRSFLDTRQISRSDRLRFLRSYLRHQADRRARERTLWKRVLEGTRRKLAELDEAFR